MICIAQTGVASLYGEGSLAKWREILRKGQRYSLGHYIIGAMAVIGVVGWVMLVVPELHFVYKQVIPVLGTGKYIAFLVMGMAMFFCMPIALTRKAFMLLLPAKCQTLFEKLVMGLFCILSIVISRSFM